MIKKWFISIIVGLLCLTSNTASAQEIGITAFPDTNIILIGQQIELTVSITAQDKDIVRFPILLDSVASKVEIVRQTEWDTASVNGFFKFTKTLKITSWDSGYHAIPPIPAMINSDTFATRAFMIGVATMTLDTTNAIADIKTIATDPLTWQDYFDAYWHYAAWLWLVALACGLIIIIYLRFNKKPEPIVEIKEVIPAHIIAFGKLKLLEDEKLWQNNQIKQYHVQLSEITREYIENRFKIFALEQTTEEIMHYMRLSELSEDQKRVLRKLLMLTDLVKFAKESPLANENEQVLKDAYDLVESTKKTEVEPTQNSNS